MERKIGEIFEYNGEWYQCVRGEICADCAFAKKHCNENPLFEAIDSCSKYFRKDATSVIFKKLEKVGEPYEFDGHLFQSYRTFEVPIFTENYATVRELGNNSKISIEIKQNKEDMEEKKLNLKPFSLEAAKLGKPVCTRDGRKVRIICFDYKGDANAYPILALISTSNLSGVPSEIIAKYTEDGRYAKYNNVENDEDLMMLPEKKEGWVNVYKDSVYNTKEEALAGRSKCIGYIDTIKLSWEE